MNTVAYFEGLLIRGELQEARRFLEWNRSIFSEAQFQVLSKEVNCYLLERKIGKMFKQPVSNWKCA